MSFETTGLIDMVLATEHATDCVINATASPAGATIRVLFDSPFFGQNAQTGEFQNSDPQAYAKKSDTAGITPETTILGIKGKLYVVKAKKPVEGDDNWRLLTLRHYGDQQ